MPEAWNSPCWVAVVEAQECKVRCWQEGGWPGEARWAAASGHIQGSEGTEAGSPLSDPP